MTKLRPFSGCVWTASSINVGYREQGGSAGAITVEVAKGAQPTYEFLEPARSRTL